MSSIAEHRQRAKSRKSQTIKNAQGVCVQTMPKKRWNESFIGVKFFQLRIFNKTLLRKKTPLCCRALTAHLLFVRRQYWQNRENRRCTLLKL